uniref:PROCN domain-containing protein n=1 Tax=Globodera pallida TaxID=36090 RepID=A0A183CLH4_GLOPA
MNPGKGLEKEPNPYGNLMDLPIMAKLEVWIGDRSHKESVCTTLISELRARIYKLEIPSTTFRPFIAINRVQHWTKEAQKCNTTPNFMSYPKRSFKRIVLPFHKETKDKDLYKEWQQPAKRGEVVLLAVFPFIVLPLLLFG